MPLKSNINHNKKFHVVKWHVVTAIVVIFLLLVGYSAEQYNSIQIQEERINSEWSNLLNQYTRRADLVTNLALVVKSYASHEAALFNEIATARAPLSSLLMTIKNNQDVKRLSEFEQAEKVLSTQLSKLLVISEQYPDLKANELFRDLLAQIEGTENRISYSRQRYIIAIANYNITIRLFPSNLIARIAGYKPKPQFNVENESIIYHAPQVDLK